MDEWWLDFAEHDNLVLRDKVLAVVDPDRVLVALRSGRLRRIQRGVYVPRSRYLSPTAYARAAIISSGVSDAVASHETAARIHGLALADPVRTEHVTVPSDTRRAARKDLRFHTRRLNCGDTVLLDGVPVTSMARTVGDLAAHLDRLPAVWLLDDALRRRLLSRADVESTVARWAGGMGCRSALTRLREADGKAESILETAGRLVLRDAGMPLPIPQFEVRDGAGVVVARLDGAYPHRRVGLEFDGRGVHDLPEAIYRDRTRQNALAALGWTVLRFTWWDVREDPRRFVAAIAAAGVANGGVAS